MARRVGQVPIEDREIGTAEMEVSIPAVGLPPLGTG